MSPVMYIEDKFKVVEKKNDLTALGTRYSPPTGYSRKWPSSYMIRLEGHRGWYRVYWTCFSNAASHWITVKGERYCVRDGDTVRP